MAGDFENSDAISLDVKSSGDMKAIKRTKKRIDRRNEDRSIEKKEGRKLDIKGRKLIRKEVAMRDPQKIVTR